MASLGYGGLPGVPPGGGGIMMLPGAALAGMQIMPGGASSTGIPQGHPSSSSTNNFDHGVLMHLESYQEWPVKEIAFDGTEKYKIPVNYSDHVGALSRKIDWSKLIGDDDTTYDNPNLVVEKKVKTRSSSQKRKKKKKGEKMQAPEAGPWQNVARCLHESLQQLNVLMDDLAILRSTPYMDAVQILDPMKEASANSQEMFNSSKHFQWISKRKALCESARALEVAVNQRLGLTSPTRGASGHSLSASDSLADGTIQMQRDVFFQELRKMRELWRVRKQGDHIFGDLGYKIFANKQDGHGLFDISRKILDKSSHVDKSVMTVSVPKDLMKRTTLTVTIVKDDESTKNLFGCRDDEAFAFMEVDRKEAEKLPWEKALQYAQETLICRDIFNMLSTDAVQLTRRLAVVGDSVVLVCLFDSLLLRFELKSFPFTATSVPDDGDAYLTRLLRECHLAMECTRPIRPQSFVDLPLTRLPQSLDSRGPLAFTNDEIEARYTVPKGILNRMTKAASHYWLVKQTVSVLKEHTIACNDPQLNWRWIRASPVHSMVICTLHNRNYEYVIGKVTYYIHITTDGVSVQPKDLAPMECRRDCNELRYTLHYMNASFHLSTISSMAKNSSFQVLHANLNAMDENGRPAPTLYLVNNASTRVVFIVFPLAEDPTVATRRFIADEKNATQDDLKFTYLQYKRMPGRSMCKKFDTMFAMFKN